MIIFFLNNKGVLLCKLNKKKIFKKSTEHSIQVTGKKRAIVQTHMRTIFKIIKIKTEINDRQIKMLENINKRESWFSKNINEKDRCFSKSDFYQKEKKYK